MAEEDWAAAADEQERRLTGQVDKLAISNTAPRPPSLSNSAPIIPPPIGSSAPKPIVPEQKPNNNDESGWDENSTQQTTDQAKEAESTSEELAESSLLSKLLRNRLVTSKHEVEVLRRDPNSPLYSAKSFEELPLSAQLKKGVYEMGFNKPSKIQETALPLLLADPPNNMIAQSQSGTGKTAAFVLTMLSRVDATKEYPQVLCLSPTYELAMQTGKVAEQMGKHCPHIRITYAVRGHQLQRGQRCTDHIIIGTPGTVLDWIRKLRAFDPKKINVFVLDEADIMIAMQGHQDQSIRVQKSLPRNCQTLLFSATYDDEVMKFALSVVSNPIEIRLRREEESLDNIKQFYVMCKSANNKFDAICNIYGVLNIGQCIVFCMTRRSASWLAEKMVKCGHPVAMLSGELTIDQRLAVINRFREGKEKVLITTNVSARGLDIEQVTLVINYDMPLDQQGRPDFETYLHRIGRTGRFGKTGIAINFIDGERSLNVMKKIEEHFNRKIALLDADDVDELEKLN